MSKCTSSLRVKIYISMFRGVKKYALVMRISFITSRTWVSDTKEVRCVAFTKSADTTCPVCMCNVMNVSRVIQRALPVRAASPLAYVTRVLGLQRDSGRRHLTHLLGLFRVSWWRSLPSVHVACDHMNLSRSRQGRRERIGELLGRWDWGAPGGTNKYGNL